MHKESYIFVLEKFKTGTDKIACTDPVFNCIKLKTHESFRHNSDIS